VPVITKLLVANRGEIASRVFRTARSMGMATVAVHSDADAGLPYVDDADEAVRLPGVLAADTYLRADRLIDAARRTGAGAVHPGYGFLAENAAFARACEQAGLIWVGPPPAAIEAMGSKVEAKRLMAAAGVPVLPGRTVGGADAEAELHAAATEIGGYPVLVKAVYGGGGRGMRIATSPDELLDAVTLAQSEAASAFGDGTVFLEPLVEAPRHVEVQVFGDTHGTVIHLFERECSIQRRHQKVVEEAPSPAVDDALRSELCAAAVAAAKAIGYVGAGTVEFVLDHEGRFFFLEVNTRLQVEHPVSELVTGLDLVRLQLEVAQGRPLPADAAAATMNGHAIEARLYAEDVRAGFMPTSGALARFHIPDDAGVRVDAGYADGTTVSTFYDAMLAKVIAWAPTRDEAASKLASALARSRVHGVVTNRELLVSTLRHPEFVAGRTDTGFYDRHHPVDLAAGAGGGLARHRVHAVAAVLAADEANRVQLPTPAGIPPRWRNVGPARQAVEFDVDGERIEVLETPESWDVRAVCASSVEVEIDGVGSRVEVHRVGDIHYVDSPAGSSVLHEVPQFPLPLAVAASGSLLAPMPGLVVAVLVAAGDTVVADQAVAVLEAMKMQYTIRAPQDGVVADVRSTAGDQVDGGTVLLVIEEG
jgi:acetyl/propionyl-CoA carboxylase alpha subunit